MVIDRIRMNEPTRGLSRRAPPSKNSRAVLLYVSTSARAALRSHIPRALLLKLLNPGIRKAKGQGPGVSGLCRRKAQVLDSSARRALWRAHPNDAPDDESGYLFRGIDQSKLRDGVCICALGSLLRVRHLCNGAWIWYWDCMRPFDEYRIDHCGGGWWLLMVALAGSTRPILARPRL